MNVCSIDSKAAMGGRTLIRMLGSTGLQISFDQEIANAEKRRQILRKKEMTTFERRWQAKTLSDLLPKAAVKLSSSLLKFRAWLYKCHIMISWISLWSDPSQRGRAMISDIWAFHILTCCAPYFSKFPWYFFGFCIRHNQFTWTINYSLKVLLSRLAVRCLGADLVGSQKLLIKGARGFWQGVWHTLLYICRYKSDLDYKNMYFFVVTSLFSNLGLCSWA